MYKIAVIGGDGTGPEVACEGIKVLKSVGDKFNLKFTINDNLFNRSTLKMMRISEKSC